MFWRWFQDWRERRAALAEVNSLRLADEAVLMDQNQNPLNLAMLSVVSDPVEGAVQWERARRLVPNAVLESEDSLEILLRLERYDDADALMRERYNRSRFDNFSLTGLARIAERRGDIPEALKRWEVVRTRVRDTIEGYLGCARCLLHLGRFEEAEAQLNQAIRRDPHSHEVRVARARASDRRQDWEESITRWKLTAESVQDAPAFAFVAKAMMELGRLEEAEAYLAQPALRFPSEPEIALTRCQIAERRGDLAAAAERWTTVRAMNPHLPATYREGARRLFDLGRHSEADAVLKTAIERFPDDFWPLYDYARLAHDRQNWDEATARWAALRQRFPSEDAGYSLGAEALKAAGREHEVADLFRDRG
jgi:tetratricopeptide (TPR) repeat protein